MAPVILALRREPWARVRVLATAQHRQMLDQALAPFGIAPDVDLDLMRPDQALADLTARTLSGVTRNVAGSMSQKTGVAPVGGIASALA